MILVTRGEKDMFIRNSIAQGTGDVLKKELKKLDSDLFSTTRYRSSVSNAMTWLDKINREILVLFNDGDKIDKFKNRVTNKVKRLTIVKTTHDFNCNDDQCSNYFVNYYVIYVALRDSINYYTKNNKINKTVLTGAKGALTRIAKDFKEQLNDADLEWIEELDNKVDKYEYEAKLIIV